MPRNGHSRSCRRMSTRAMCTSRRPQNGIRFGLAAIKNVGESAITSIVANKPFKSIFDFCERVDLRAVNKRVVESLIKAGAFDSVDPDRALLYNNVDRAMEWGQRKQREKEVGQGGLFGMMSGGFRRRPCDGSGRAVARGPEAQARKRDAGLLHYRAIRFGSTRRK